MLIDKGLNSRINFHGDRGPIRFPVGESDFESSRLTFFLGGGRQFGDPRLQGNFMDQTRNGEADEECDVDEDNEEGEVEEGQKREDLLGRLAMDVADEEGRENLNDRRLLRPVAREGDIGQSSVDGSEMNIKVTIADSDGKLYYPSHNLQTTRDCAPMRMCVRAEDGSWQSLKTILSDPITGALMDDAVILPCGHSFGAGSIEKIKITKSCYTCSQQVSYELMMPNLSLRVVVQAFRQEEESQYSYSSKRRKQRSDQDARTAGDSLCTNTPRSRGVQLPFSVGDRIIVKGNKRTPQRFVGRPAVVTTQCLNGWYVVKTLDNAECVKLQHCSLAKLLDDSFPKAVPIEMALPWL